MNFNKLVNMNQNKLSDLDKVLLSYILENKESVASLSILELSEKSYVSKSTIIRFVKKLGFSGYSEFRYFLKQSQGNNESTPQEFDLYMSQKADIAKTLADVSQKELASINDLIHHSQIIYAYGTGYSQRKAIEEFGKQLIACGKKVIVIPNKTELSMIANIMTDKDCMFIASLSGETSGIKNTILELNIRNIPIISVTREKQNFLSQHADYQLFYSLTPFGVREGFETLSFITLQIILDVVFRSFVTYSSEREQLYGETGW